MSFKGEYIWIIGASSGIGEALARALAAEGAWLILSARNQDALESLNRELGGKHYVYPLDVSDSAQVDAVTDAILSETGRLDRVIFMAAIYRPGETAAMDREFARTLVSVNLLGAIYTSYAVLPVLERQQYGQLVLCGSVAGYTGLPGGQPYSATKAAIINYAETLYAEAPDGVDIKVMNPGFVRTRMTDQNDFHMPMRIEPEQAAQAILKGLRSKGFEITFPKRFTWLVKLLRILPYPLRLRVTRGMRGREAA